VRNYGTAEDPVHLTLKAPPLGEVMQVAIMKRGRHSLPEQVAARVQADQHPQLRTNMLMFTSSQDNLRVYLLNMPSTDFARVRDARSLSIRSTSGLNETLALSQMGPVLRTLERCVADLRQVWNVREPAGEQSELPHRARGSLSGIFQPDDYPEAAMRRNGEGRVNMVILLPSPA
jgi:hypothetical protein